jgi:hypothetical protein
MATLKPQGANVLVEAEHKGLRKWEFFSNKVDLTVRCVCAKCNSGWMSNLENEIKPILTEMLHGREVRLTRDNQRRLCIWAIKTVMVMEFLGASSRTPYFTPDERHGFMNSPAPPPSTGVFLAGYVGQHSFCGEEHHIVFKDANSDFPGYSVTMVFGSLVIQTLSHRANAQGRWFKVAANFDSASLEIWPRSTEYALWPPAEVFDDEGIRAFATRWQSTSL